MDMIYEGNFRHWITQEMIDYMMTNKGRELPRDFGETPEERDEGFVEKCGENCKAAVDEAGWDLRNVYWEEFTEDCFPFEVNMPWPKDAQVSWWFVKMMPGHCMGMHMDNELIGRPGTQWWMGITDYDSGHLFVCNDEILKGYKSGDLYRFPNMNTWHGSANIGWSTRIILNIAVYYDGFDLVSYDPKK